MVTIAMAEDNATHRGLLKNEIATNGYKLLFDAVDGKDLLRKLQSAKVLPQVLLLDIQMPYVNGLAATTYITFKYPSIKIIGVSSHTNERLVSEIISEGATGFISKHFLTKDSIIYIECLKDINILQNAIDTVLQNKRFVDKLVVNDPDDLDLSMSTQQIIEVNYKYLKPRLVEFAILNATDLKIKDIADLLCVSYDAVRKYYKQLAKEFKVTSSEKLAKACMENGIVKFASYYDKYMS